MEEERPGFVKSRVVGKNKILEACKEVGSGIWKREVKKISNEFGMILKVQMEKNYLKSGIDVEKLNAKIKSNVEKLVTKWESSATDFFKNYKKLQLNHDRRKLSSTTFFNPLFDFVVELEAVYDTLNSEFLKLGFTEKPYHDSFPVFQAACTGYMKYYNAVENKELSNIGGLLGFAKKHRHIENEDITLKHLGYVWDSKGILLFTIFPHENIQGGLHDTYVPYGTDALNSLQERRVLFHYNSDTPRIVENPGYYIDVEGEYVGIRYYTGAENSSQSLPFTFNSGVKIVPPAEVRRLGLFLFGKINPSFEKTRLVLLDFLQGADKGFIELPRSPVEKLEAHYIHLLDLSEKQGAHSDDPDFSYALQCVQNEFCTETLEKAISQARKDLKEAMVAEEEKKIRMEQDQRGQMVINDAHETSSEKKSATKARGKNRKGKKIPLSREKEKEIVKAQEIDPTIRKEIRRKAKKRINLLKNKSIRENQKSLKYDKYLKLVNVAIQGLREAGVSVEMALNKSSHGCLTIGDQKLPLCVPHGGRDTITASSAKSTLDTLLGAYLNVLGGKEEGGRKSE
ncbi:MAG TPA: hypothetical protein VMW10_04990 [Alphaproteobacteria bacterium]|nr:hypothetical protein [Alphaproteobacteria bacterium]